MEHLSYLRKLYEFGETLSAEELNEIVQYINTSIETINILIDREYAINNGHCEIRYKNSAQQPTKPATGSSGYSDGWSATYTEPDTEHGEITWMSICFLNGNGEYGVWSSPVRITWGTTSEGSGGGSSQGRDGEPGAFKSRVFKRQNTKPERPTGGSYSNPIPPPSQGWSDGIPQGQAIIWSSVCTFYGDGTSSGWSDPAQESDTANLDVEFSPRRDKPNPPQGNIPFSNHEAEGWYDPNSPNFNTAGEMIWRAERKVSNGVYNGPWVISGIVGEGGEQGPTGKTGGHHEYRYKNHQITSANPIPVKPTTGTDGTQNGWAIQQPSLSSQDLLNRVATFMTQCFVNEDREYGEWTTPMRITGENGKDGEDGDEIEFIYARSATMWTNPAEYTPATIQQDDWTGSSAKIINGQTVVTVWTDHPQGVEENFPFEYICQRNKIDGTWGPFSSPVVWSRWGRNGMDGDGCEYVFVRTQTEQRPTINPNDSDTYQNKTYLDDEYLPLSSAGRCTDDPIGVDTNYRYEWVAIRKMTSPDALGVRTWTKYSGQMALWSVYTDSPIRVDLDNENDTMLYSSSKGLVSGHVVSNAHLYDGSRDMTGYATWSIASYLGCTCSIENNTITVTDMSAMSGKVVVEASYNGSSYQAILTLKKIIDGDKYELIINPAAISYNKTTDTPSTTTVTVETWRTTADGVREKYAPPQGYSIYLLDSGNNSLIGSSSAYSFTQSIDNSAIRGDIIVKIAQGQNSSEHLDLETIPICKVDDGQSSFKSTMFVRMNNTPTKPGNNKGSFSDPNPSNCVAGQNSDGVSVSWEDGIPAGENILWATSRTFTSNGQAPQDSEWSTPRQMTDTSTYDVEFAKKQPNNAEPPTPTDANRHNGSGPQIWFDPTNDPQEDFKQMYWRAEREKKNGVWGNWIINNIKGEKGDFVNAYQISSNIGAVHFRSGESQKDVQFIFNSYKLIGENPLVAEDTDTVPCYFAIYSRTGSTYSRLDYTTSLYAFWHPIIQNVSVNYDELLVVSSPNALSSSNYSSNFPTSYYTYLSIHIVKDGVDGFIVDLTNEMDGIPCTNDLRIIQDTDMYSQIQAFFGTNDVTSECKIKISHQVGYVDGIYLESSNSGTGNTAITTSFQTIGSNKWIRLNFSRVATITGGKREVEFEIKHDSYGLAVVRIIVLAMKGGAIYNLVPSDNIVRKSGSTYSPSTITCSVSKLDVNSGQSSTNPTEATIKYTKDDTSTEYTYSGALTAGSTFTKSIKFLLYVGGNVVDEETVKIISDGANGADGTNGNNGAQGKYEEKQYAVSSSSVYANTTQLTPPTDIAENRNDQYGWKSTPPLVTTTRPFLWQRVRTYNPATNSYDNNGAWSYMRVTGEKGLNGTNGTQGKTGLWYAYAGVWGHDCGVGTNNPVKNTDQIGYYVKKSSSENSFYMNIAPAGTENTNNPPGTNWVSMHSDFKYIISEALFADEAYLGSFVINHDWFISKYGKLRSSGGIFTDIGSSNYMTKYSGKVPYAWFSTSDPSATTNPSSEYKFAPNIAIDAKTGEVYFNKAYIKGQVNATSGKIGNWTINANNQGGLTADVDSNSNNAFLHIQRGSDFVKIGGFSLSDPEYKDMMRISVDGGNSIVAYGSCAHSSGSSGGTGINAIAVNGDSYISGNTGNFGIKALSYGSKSTAIYAATSSSGVGTALDVYGNAQFTSGLFSVGCAVQTTDFTLPSNPKIGTIFLCKGSNLTVTTRNHKVTEGSDGSTLIASGGASHNFSSTTFILFFTGSEWALLYSA